MIKKTLKTARKFYTYQQERFPVVVLTISLFPAILSSGAVVSSHPMLSQMAFALIASIAYLLHIRVIDEHRDFEHDNTHHFGRPIQVGVISKKELKYVDILAILVLVAIAVSAGLLALALSVLMLGYSYLAAKEFFMGEKIRSYFFTYNALNLIQMLLMQIFVYVIFANTLPVNKLVVAHFLFTTVGTLVFEFVRKLKIPGEDGTGRDTYTWYLDFDHALTIYQAFIFLDALLFFWIATLISPHVSAVLFFALVLTIAASFSTLIHKMKKTRQTEQLMQLSFLLLYGFFNIAIYFLRIT